MSIQTADLNVMVKAANKASKVLIRDFGEVEKLQVSQKGPGDFSESPCPNSMPRGLRSAES